MNPAAAVLADAFGGHIPIGPGADAIIAAVVNGLPLAMVAEEAGAQDDPLWRGALEVEAARAAVRAETIRLLADAVGTDRSQVALCTPAWRPGTGRDVDLLIAPSRLASCAARLRESGLIPLPGWSESDSAVFVRIDSGSIVDLIELGTAAPGEISEGGGDEAGGGFGRLTLLAQRDRVLGRLASGRQVRLVDLADLRFLADALDAAPAPRNHVHVAVALAVGTLELAALGPSGFPCPLPLAGRARPAALRLALGRLRRRVRPARAYRVAFSGVDGSGKTTHASALARSLERISLPVTVTWNRPGAELGPVDRMAVFTKRVLREQTSATVERQLAAIPAWGIAATAPGLSTATGPGPRSRRGVVGWGWLWMIVAVTIVRSRRSAQRANRTGGVAIFERHLLDALVDVEWRYGTVSGRSQRAALRWLLPRADLTVRIFVDAEVAAARKPDDVFRLQHLAHHAAIAAALPDPRSGDVIRLDSADAAADNRDVVLRRVLTAVFAAPPRGS